MSYKNIIILLMGSVLFTSCTSVQVYKGGSQFQYGFARIVKTGKSSSGKARKNQAVKSLYIDTTGHIAFNKIIKKHTSFGHIFHRGAIYQPGDRLPHRVVKVKKGGQTGILTTGGQWILHPVYDSVNTSNPVRWMVAKNGKKSIFTSMGFRVPFRFDDVVMLGQRYYRVQKDKNWGIYDRTEKKLVVPAVYQEMKRCSGCSKILAKKNDKWGVINFKNEVKVSFDYKAELRMPRRGKGVFELRKNILNRRDTRVVHLAKRGASKKVVVDTAQNKHRFIVRKNKKYGLVDAKGAVVLPVSYDYVTFEFAPPHYITIYQNNKKGIANMSGQIILKPDYNSIYWVEGPDSTTLFIAEKGYKSILVNSHGKKVLPGTYQNINSQKTPYHTGKANTRYLELNKDGKYGLYNPQTGAWAKVKYGNIDNSKYEVNLPDRVKVTLNGKESLLNVRTGKLALPFLFESVSHSSNPYLPKNLFIVKNDSHYGVYDTEKKKLVVPLKYTLISAYHHLFYVQTKQGEGLMNFRTKVILPAKYDRIHTLNDTLFVLTQKKGNSRSYIYFNSKTGQKHPLSYQLKGTVSVNRVIIKDGNRFKLYNPFEEKVIRGEYAAGGLPDSMNIAAKKIIAVYKNGKAGLINPNGNYIVPLKYNLISAFNGRRAVVVKQNHETGQQVYGFINPEGKIIVPLQYDFDLQREFGDYFYRNKLVLLEKSSKGDSYLMGLANKDGTNLLPADNQLIIPQQAGKYYIIKKKNKFGVLDASGEAVLPPVFEQIVLSSSPYLSGRVKETSLLNMIKEFDFPLITKKGKYWRYYSRKGKPLPGKFKKMISFLPQ